jgi:hypothetical protein
MTTITPAQEQSALDNTLIIANVGLVAGRVVRKLIGSEEVSGEIAGQKAPLEMLQQMSHREAAEQIKNRTGATA